MGSLSPNDEEWFEGTLPTHLLIKRIIDNRNQFTVLKLVVCEVHYSQLQEMILYQPLNESAYQRSAIYSWLMILSSIFLHLSLFRFL